MYLVLNTIGKKGYLDLQIAQEWYYNVKFVLPDSNKHHRYVIDDDVIVINTTPVQFGGLNTTFYL